MLQTSSIINNRKNTRGLEMKKLYFLLFFSFIFSLLTMDKPESQELQSFSIAELAVAGKLPKIQYGYKFGPYASLDLSGMHINNLEGLSQIPKIEIVNLLDLEDNQIGTLKANALTSLKKLRLLFLEDNQISVIEERSFAGSNKLNVLDLSNNQIKTINKSTFSGLTSLERLDLRNNKISVIEADAFVSIKRPEETRKLLIKKYGPYRNYEATKNLSLGVYLNGNFLLEETKKLLTKKYGDTISL